MTRRGVGRTRDVSLLYLCVCLFVVVYLMAMLVTQNDGVINE